MKMIFLSQLKPIIGTAAAAAMVLGGTAVVLNGAPPQRAMANAAPAPAVAAASIAAPATQATTPLSDLRILAKAIKNGDAETIQKYLHGSTPQEQAVCQQQAKLCKSIFEFRKAYGEAFGPKALAQLPALAGPISVPAGSKETIDGDTAIVEFPGAPIAINMVKADGVWKMDYSSIGTSSLPLSADQVAEWLKKMQLGIDEVTMRTTTGNYKTPAQAMGALQKMMVGLSRSLSKPTTAPAK